VGFTKTAAKKDWVLTKEGFDRFLATLDTDRDKAGEKYENIRLKLLKYFQWCGSVAPDIDADETINRVTRRIEEGANIYNLAGYIYGVAKLVHIESLKRRNQQEMESGYLVELLSTGRDSNAAQCQECLKRCLGYLSDEDREVITEYYQYEKFEDRTTGRKRLAERLGVPLTTLRVKTYRQRLNLEACVEECLGRYE
jgi:DNA-directed RNA polymerase specialized sigma24 family protein